MTAAVFVVEESRLAGLAPGDRFVVDGPEGRHGSAVRRLQVGEQVDVVDGAGLRARGTVAAVPAGDRFDVAVAELVAEPVLQPRITVAMALLKGERMERAVAMLTELGVDEIIPWAAARSIAQWRPDRAAKAHARLVGTVQAAGKQSRRARFPQLAPLADAERVADRIGRADSGLVLHEEAADPLARAELPDSGEIVAVVGPEGGIAPPELQRYRAAGAQAVALGPTVLRAETAATAGSALVMARCGRWRAQPTFS
jgi:16S rRNA (uracil1498-N3)-methyltransferase